MYPLHHNAISIPAWSRLLFYFSFTAANIQKVVFSWHLVYHGLDPSVWQLIVIVTAISSTAIRLFICYPSMDVFHYFRVLATTVSMPMNHNYDKSHQIMIVHYPWNVTYTMVAILPAETRLGALKWLGGVGWCRSGGRRLRIQSWFTSLYGRNYL